MNVLFTLVPLFSLNNTFWAKQNITITVVLYYKYYGDVFRTSG